MGPADAGPTFRRDRFLNYLAFKLEFRPSQLPATVRIDWAVRVWFACTSSPVPGAPVAVPVPLVEFGDEGVIASTAPVLLPGAAGGPGCDELDGAAPLPELVLPYDPVLLFADAVISTRLFTLPARSIFESPGAATTVYFVPTGALSVASDDDSVYPWLDDPDRHPVYFVPDAALCDVCVPDAAPPVDDGSVDCVPDVVCELAAAAQNTMAPSVTVMTDFMPLFLLVRVSSCR